VSTAGSSVSPQSLDIATLVTIPGARHEIMMERDELRELFFARSKRLFRKRRETGVFRAAE